jgi:hypothetical protein
MAFTMVKTVVLAAMPSPMETATAAVKPGFLRNVRRANRIS